MTCSRNKYSLCFSFTLQTLSSITMECSTRKTWREQKRKQNMCCDNDILRLSTQSNRENVGQNKRQRLVRAENSSSPVRKTNRTQCAGKDTSTMNRNISVKSSRTNKPANNNESNKSKRIEKSGGPNNSSYNLGESHVNGKRSKRLNSVQQSLSAI